MVHKNYISLDKVIKTLRGNGLKNIDFSVQNRGEIILP